MHADGAEEYDSEGSDSDEDDEHEHANGIFEGDQSEEEEESDDSDEADGFVHRSSVIIEEVHDGEHGAAQITTAVTAPMVSLYSLKHVHSACPMCMCILYKFHMHPMHYFCMHTTVACSQWMYPTSACTLLLHEPYFCMYTMHAPYFCTNPTLHGHNSCTLHVACTCCMCYSLM